MENVIPAGTKRFGKASESSWVVFPFKGSITANEFTIIVAIQRCYFLLLIKDFSYSFP